MSALMGRFSISTRLSESASDVWKRACSFEGINDELGPYLRMTIPPALRESSIGDVAAGSELGRSWLLLGGLIPVDFDDLVIAELDPPRRFLERSRMLSMSAWEHEREIDPDGDSGCVISDRLEWRLRDPLMRVPGAEPLASRMVAATFRHRHRRLIARHGAAEPR